MQCYSKTVGFVTGLALLYGCFGSALAAADLPQIGVDQTAQPKIIAWRSDYRAACDEARNCGKQVLVWFCDPAWQAGDAAFERHVLGQNSIAAAVEANYVPVKVPLDATAQCNEQQLVIFDHPAFAHLSGRPGLAIIDYRDSARPWFGHVVSVYPFVRDYISSDRLATLLSLPEGTLTQRTLIYAVRTHPERPTSTANALHPVLVAEAASHAAHQASINLQGHHAWETRFHRINAQLPGGLLAQEVCAESWPGQTLIDAAVECVDSWRHSSGHWQAVSSRPQYYAYDMQRGANGVWYAAGIFAQHH
jgi:hypothetical protein